MSTRYHKLVREIWPSFCSEKIDLEILAKIRQFSHFSENFRPYSEIICEMFLFIKKKKNLCKIICYSITIPLSFSAIRNGIFPAFWEKNWLWENKFCNFWSKICLSNFQHSVCILKIKKLLVVRSLRIVTIERFVNNFLL